MYSEITLDNCVTSCTMASFLLLPMTLPLDKSIVRRGTKRALVYARDHTVQESLAQVKMWNSAFLQSDDLLEAMRAVMAKQQPEYKKN
jgi:enoyl-CoA hydratase/carnithine racemase